MIIGIYLAAGLSRRMGRAKLALPLGGMSLGGIALQTAAASSLDSIAVVTRPEDSLDWVPPSLCREPHADRWFRIPCGAAAQGLSESVKCGLRAAEQRRADAVMMLLADQPFVSAALIDDILSHYRHSRTGFIAASSGGIARPPVLFDSSLFPELYRLQGDQGARELIRRQPQPGGLLLEQEESSLYSVDVDTPGDYRAVLELQEGIRWKATMSSQPSI